MQKSSLSYFIFILSSFTLFIGSQFLLADPDAGWHLAAGKWIIANGEIPTHDVFSFTAAKNEWLNIAWLWDVIFGFLDLHFGLYAPLAAIILTSSATLAIITSLSYARSASNLASLAVVIAGAIMFFAATSIRPNVSSFLLLAISLVAMSKFKSDSSLRKYYLIFPLITALWANLHGGFLLLLPLLGAYWLEFLFRKDHTKLKHITLIALLCLVSTLLNPLGYRVYEAIYITLDGPLTQYINEWQAANKWYHFIYPAIVLYSLVSSYKKFSLAENVLAAFWLAMAISSARYLPVLFLFTAPICSLAAKGLLSKLDGFTDKDKEYSQDLASNKARKLAISLCCAVSLLVAFGEVLKFSDGAKFPQHETAQRIINAASSGKVLNHYDLGGVIIYLSDGGVKTFIDGRADTVFDESITKEYMLVVQQQEGWQEVLNKYEIDLIAFPKQSRTAVKWLTSLGKSNRKRAVSAVFY